MADLTMESVDNPLRLSRLRIYNVDLPYELPGRTVATKPLSILPVLPVPHGVEIDFTSVGCNISKSFKAVLKALCLCLTFFGI